MDGSWDLAVAVAALLVSIVIGYLNLRYTKKQFAATNSPIVKARFEFEISPASFMMPFSSPGGTRVSLVVHNTHDRVPAQNLRAVIQVAFVRFSPIQRRLRTALESVPVDLPPATEIVLSQLQLEAFLLDQHMGLQWDEDYRPQTHLGEQAFECYRLSRKGRLHIKAVIKYESPSGVRGQVLVDEKLEPSLMDNVDGKPRILREWVRTGSDQRRSSAH